MRADPLKLCFLANANSIHSRRWITYFANRGHWVDWISLVPPNDDIPANLALHLIRPYPSQPLSLILSVLRVRKLLRRLRPHLLHVHYAGVNGVVGILSGCRPLVVTAWGSDVLIAGQARLTKWPVRYVLRRADRITCDAAHMRQAIERLGAAADKIRLIYFGTDTRHFSPGAPDASLRHELGGPAAQLIISLRSLEPVYDVATLIQAAPLVLRQHPEARFVIAGDGSQAEMLKNLVATLGLADQVRFVGRISQDKLPDYLRTADIYVSTSLSDAGLAASTAEAMACGLPVVVTDSGENRLWVKDGENGFVVPVRDAISLADRITYLLDNRTTRRKLGRAGRRLIEERNNYETEMAKMEAIYRESVA